MQAAWKAPSDVLIVFAKAPVPGRVKTRLCPPLEPGQAAALHAAFVRDALAAAAKVRGARLRLAYDAAGGSSAPGRLGISRLPVWFPQRGADLGERMARAFDAAFNEGARKVVVIGTDAPLLGADLIREAFAALDRNDCVLGPAEDGGYYLIGLARPRRGDPAPEARRAALFTRIPWSTASVLSRTLARARRIGLSVGLLPRMADVDTPADLRRLRQALLNDPAACPATRRVLSRLETAEPRIHLVYFDGCPHVAAARRNLRAALRRLGRELKWKEIDLNSDACPSGWRGFPSPTVLVDGADVATGRTRSKGPPACRFGGSPAAELIAEALTDRRRRAMPRRTAGANR